VQLGVNVPNFGPGTDPDVLRRWALTVEGLGFDLLMVSDHVAVTPDVAEQYPAPFYEPFTTLAWLAGLTRRIRLGTTVLILPYRHPLLTARMAANLNDLSGGRLILGIGAGGTRACAAAAVEGLASPWSAAMSTPARTISAAVPSATERTAPAGGRTGLPKGSDRT